MNAKLNLFNTGNKSWEEQVDEMETVETDDEYEVILFEKYSLKQFICSTRQSLLEEIIKELPKRESNRSSGSFNVECHKAGFNMCRDMVVDLLTNRLEQEKNE
jgi:hypothetical protein